MALVWTIFNSHISWADHVMWGMCVCICALKVSEVRVIVLYYSVLYVGMMMKRREKVKRDTGIEPIPVDEH